MEITPPVYTGLEEVYVCIRLYQNVYPFIFFSSMLAKELNCTLYIFEFSCVHSIDFCTVQSVQSMELSDREAGYMDSAS